MLCYLLPVAAFLLFDASHVRVLRCLHPDSMQEGSQVSAQLQMACFTQSITIVWALPARQRRFE